MKLHANFHIFSTDFMTKVKAWERKQVNKMSQNSNMFPKLWENAWENESQQSQIVFHLGIKVPWTPILKQNCK